MIFPIHMSEGLQRSSARAAAACFIRLIFHARPAIAPHNAPVNTRVRVHPGNVIVFKSAATPSRMKPTTLDCAPLTGEKI